jgi:pyruvate,water dikinase
MLPQSRSPLQISLVQARPMTALPERVAWEPPHRGGAWTRTFRWGEWLPDPVSPLFASWFFPRTQTTFVEGSLRILGAVITGPIHGVVNGWYFHSGSGTRNTLAMVPGILWRKFRFMRAIMSTASDPVAAEPIAAAPSRRFYEDELLPRYRALAEEAVPDQPEAQIDYIDRVCDVHGELMLSMTLVGGFAWKVESAVARFFRKHLSGVEGVPHELVAGLAPVPPPGAHLCCSLDWMHPTAGELGMAGGEPFLHAGAAARREALEQACLAALSPKLQARFHGMLGVARDYAQVREQQSRELTLAWPNVRAVLRRLGARAVQAGALDSPDDVFWIERGELESALEGRSLRRKVVERRARWQHQRRLVPPLSVGVMPGFIGKMFSDFERDLRGGVHDDADTAIKGVPASAGRATGTVRIVRTPADFARFKDGEVLVATAPAPAWTPLFARAAAVVTDAGSVSAHASLVAREYGIPAVVGTRDATQRLTDGDLVLVDGSRGRVEVVGKAGEPHRRDDSMRSCSTERDPTVVLGRAGSRLYDELEWFSGTCPWTAFGDASRRAVPVFGWSSGPQSFGRACLDGVPNWGSARRGARACGSATSVRPALKRARTRRSLETRRSARSMTTFVLDAAQRPVGRHVQPERGEVRPVHGDSLTGHDSGLTASLFARKLEAPSPVRRRRQR